MIEGLPLVDHISSIGKGVDVVVLGTLYKEMRLKPDILEEMASERVISVRKTISTYVSEDREGEVIYVEDESGRLPLTPEEGCDGLQKL